MACLQVSLSLRLKDLLGPVTRVKKKLQVRGAGCLVLVLGETVCRVKYAGF